MLLLIELIGVIAADLGYSANCAVIMAEQFPPEVRATGIGLPYALAVAVFGGTAPYITTWMASAGYRDLTWIYVAAAALVGCRRLRHDARDQGQGVRMTPRHIMVTGAAGGIGLAVRRRSPPPGTGSPE